MKNDNCSSKVIIKRINSKKIDRIVLKLCNFYNTVEVMEWKSNIIKAINKLFKKYTVIKYEINQNSYMGIVIDCVSIEYGNIYIKAVPPMISRFETEINTLKVIPKEIVCKIYDVNYDDKTIVMEKILPGNQICFYGNEKIISDLFKILYNNKIETSKISDFEYKDFFDVVTKDYNICKKNKYNNDIVDMLYKCFCNQYESVCSNEVKYILHGDVYKNNMILSSNKAKVIDPLGFSAPFVFELLSICAYEMFYNEKDNKEIFNDFVKFFNIYVDEKKYKDALFCQLVKVYIPSIYEANDGGIRANKWLNIIKEMYPQYF